MTRKNAESASDSGSYGSDAEARIDELIEEARYLLDESDDEYYEQAGMKCLQEAMELGSVHAIYLMGLQYENVDRAIYSPQKATELYELAANKGSQYAMYKLASNHYYNSRGGNRYELAYRWLEQINDIQFGEAFYLRGLMKWYGQGTPQSSGKGVADLRIAADFGRNTKAMHLLGRIYETGREGAKHGMLDPVEFKPNQCEAAKYYEMAAQRGDKECQYKIALMKLHGRGTNHDYRGAFYYLWHAATAYQGSAQLELARFYMSELLFPRDITAAMFWALMSQNFEYNPQTTEFINELKTKLKKSAFVKLQQEVLDHKNTKNKDKKAIPNYLLLPDRYLELYGFNADDESDQLQEIEPQAPLAKHRTQNTNATTDNDDKIGLSAEEQYKYAHTVKKDFNPSKIKLTLLLYKPLDKTDEVDFYELKISYNNQNHDRKKVELYTAAPVKLNKKARKLLIKLALQFDTKDIEKRTSDIARILRNPNLGSDVVSAINRLAKSLFPGCFPRTCPFICKETGELKISLSIDRWMVESARDFKEVSQLV